MIPLQGTLFLEQNTKEKLSSQNEIHEEHSKREIRGFQGDEVEAHFEERVSTCLVVQNEIAQRNADNNVSRNEKTENAGTQNAVKQHPDKISLVVFKSVALQTPHALHIEDCREQKPNREFSGEENRQNRTQELVGYIQIIAEVHLSQKTEFDDGWRNTESDGSALQLTRQQADLPVTRAPVKMEINRKKTATLGNSLYLHVINHDQQPQFLIIPCHPKRISISGQ